MSQVGRRQFLMASGALLCPPLTAGAQPQTKIPQVGVLTVVPLSSLALPRHFPDALREFGYVDKQNILLEWRSAEGKRERLADLAAELVRLRVDVIVALSNPAILAAKQATATIPIVMGGSQDPVGAGLVASLARPGGNITGRAFYAPETVGKQLQILKETVPTLTRLMLLTTRGARGIPGFAILFQEAEEGARALGLTLRVTELGPTEDMVQFLEEVRRWQPDALYIGTTGISVGQRDAILKFALQQRLPTMATARGVVERGALMFYVPSTIEYARRAASYVDRILKGAKPADLPIELPQKHDLVINLKTAKALGLTIPQSILLRADEVIE